MKTPDSLCNAVEPNSDTTYYWIKLFFMLFSTFSQTVSVESCICAYCSQYLQCVCIALFSAVSVKTWLNVWKDVLSYRIDATNLSLLLKNISNIIRSLELKQSLTVNHQILVIEFTIYWQNAYFWHIVNILIKVWFTSFCTE